MKLLTLNIPASWASEMAQQVKALASKPESETQTRMVERKLLQAIL